MSPAQQRGLALWAVLLSAVVCLSFLPVSRWVSVLILLVVLGVILAFWTVASRREQHDVTLRLEDLPDATYRQPVVLVCGDLPLAWPHSSPVLTVTQGCWIRVEDHHDLAQVARQILWLRPDWGRQLSVMVSVCPQQHPDSEALTSRLLTLRWHISQLRKATGHSVPLVLNGQVGSAMTNDMFWQAVFPGEGVRVWRESSAPGSVAEWVTSGGTPALQQQVLMNSLMNWFRQHVQAVFMDENPDVPVIAPVAVLWGMGPILAGSLATSAWTTWLSRHTAMQQVAQQIIEWFAGTSIEVTLSRQYLHDLSTLGYSLSSGICRYEIATILLQNGERCVSIVPEQLFRAGETGCVRMRVEAPGFREVFYLSMAPEAGWFIRREFQSIKERALLTEERFFVAVDRLA
ncbi:hypothetical protein GV760_09145 [Enterobacter cloacae]|nr:hypothetical protein [Enterobacter cloacae]